MKIACALLSAALLCGGAAWAADESAMTVVQRHVSNMTDGNVEAVLADYAPDAILITPKGMFPPTDVYMGTDGLRQIFSQLISKENLPAMKAVKFVTESRGPDTIVMHWSGYQDQVGHDVFVVRGGKIVFQGVFSDGKK